MLTSPAEQASRENHGELCSPVRLDYPSVPIWQFLAGARRRWPDAIALRSANGALSWNHALTWNQLWTTSFRLARGLAASGLRPGQVVATHLPNCADMAAVYWAAQLAGLTVSPVNPYQPDEDARRQLGDCAARLIVTDRADERSLDALGAGLPDLRVVTTHPDTPSARALAEVAAAGDGLASFVPHHPADLSSAIAHISYTGGTTGVPKGVLVSQRNVVRNALQFCHWATGSLPALDADGGVTLDQIGSEQDWPVRLGQGVVIAVAPWFHAMGLGGGVVVPALQGTRSLLLGRFDADRFLNTVEAEGVTSISGAPAMLAQLAKHQETRARDIASVRLVSCGGGPLPPALSDRLASAFPEAVVTQAYGLTEVTMAAVGGATARGQLRSRGSVGVPMPDTEIRLVPSAEDEEGTGEILVRGPQVMLGYHGHAEETAAVLADGWLRTGDVGRVNEHGHLVVVDRHKDMLIYKGYNVYPSELENHLRECPGVLDAAVVGLPDPEVGDLPIAFVVLDGPVDGTAAPGLSPDQIASSVNAHVVHYKRIRTVHVVDALPRSTVGKVLKPALRERAAQLAAHGAADLHGSGDILRRLNERSGEMTARLGILFIEASAERVVATMPVAGNRQGYGLLHGGANVVLAETIGSALAVLSTGFAKKAVGLEVSATHHRSARDGLVIGTATVAALTSRTATIDVVVRDETGRRTCTSRLTCLLRDREPEPAT